MNRADLNAIVAVAKHRSYRKAAAALGVSPSALSYTVSNLEQRMGIRLFNRTTRSVAVSEAGEQFLARVRPALQAITEAIADADSFRVTPSGTIRINASEGAARVILAPLILQFLRRYPDMQVDLVSDGRLVDIVANGFDAGIRALENVPLDMIAVPCSPPVRFLVVGSPEYLSKNGVPAVPDDLYRHQCIRSRLPSGSLYSWEFERAGQAVIINPRGQLTLDSDNLMVDAAVSGAGLAWVSVWLVKNLIAEKKLIPVLEKWSPEAPGLQLYYPSHRHLPAGMRAFVAFLKQASMSQGS